MARLRRGRRTASSRRPEAMREKRRNGRVPTKTSVEDEIVHLRGLELRRLGAPWQRVVEWPTLLRSEGQGRQANHRGAVMKPASIKPLRCAIYTRVCFYLLTGILGSIFSGTVGAAGCG